MEEDLAGAVRAGTGFVQGEDLKLRVTSAFVRQGRVVVVVDASPGLRGVPGELLPLGAELRAGGRVLCARTSLLGDDAGPIDFEHLPDDVAEDLASAPAPRDGEPVAEADLRLQAERCVKQTVEACRGNLSEAARRLGISRNTLYRKLRESGS